MTIISEWFFSCSCGHRYSDGMVFEKMTDERPLRSSNVSGLPFPLFSFNISVSVKMSRLGTLKSSSFDRSYPMIDCFLEYKDNSPLTSPSYIKSSV